MNYKLFGIKMKVENSNIIFDEDDIYNLDSVLSSIIVNAITKFKELNNSVPGCMYTDGSGRSPSPEETQIASDNWHAILDNIIYSFSEHDVDELFNTYRSKLGLGPCAYNYKADCFVNGIFDVPLNKSFTEVDGKEWSDSRELFMVNHKKTIDSGRLLLIKYFDNLWI